MKTKYIILFVIFILLPLSSQFSQAHSGRTDNKGGHCVGGADSNGGCSGEYHYHNGEDNDGIDIWIIILIIIIILYGLSILLIDEGEKQL